MATLQLRNIDDRLYNFLNEKLSKAAKPVCQSGSCHDHSAASAFRPACQRHAGVSRPVRRMEG